MAIRPDEYSTGMGWAAIVASNFFAAAILEERSVGLLVLLTSSLTKVCKVY